MAKTWHRQPSPAHRFDNLMDIGTRYSFPEQHRRTVAMQSTAGPISTNTDTSWRCRRESGARNTGMKAVPVADIGRPL